MKSFMVFLLSSKTKSFSLFIMLPRKHLRVKVIYMEFRERLVSLRKEKKETQVQLAKAISITSRSLQQLEAGDNYPQYKTLLALADHFEVSLDYLMCRTDER